MHQQNKSPPWGRRQKPRRGYNARNITRSRTTGAKLHTDRKTPKPTAVMGANVITRKSSERNANKQKNGHPNANAAVRRNTMRYHLRRCAGNTNKHWSVVGPTREFPPLLQLTKQPKQKDGRRALHRLHKHTLPLRCAPINNVKQADEGGQ